MHLIFLTYWIVNLLEPPGLRQDLTGKVLSAEGKPVEGATVMMYTAGVRKGTSPY